jgi:hypothetical protein
MVEEAEQVRDIAAFYYGPDPSGQGPGKLADYINTGDHNTLPIITQEVIESLGDFPTPYEPLDPGEQPPDLSQTTPGVWPGIPEGGFQYGPEIPADWDFTQGPAPGIPWPAPPAGYQWPPIDWYFPVPDPDNQFLPPEGLPPVIIWTPADYPSGELRQPFSGDDTQLAQQQLVSEYLTALENPIAYSLGDVNRAFELVQELNAAGFEIEADMFQQAMMDSGMISAPPAGYMPTYETQSTHGSFASPYGSSLGRFPAQ